MCGIEAPGGVQLIYWPPDTSSNQSNVTATSSGVYTQVENGFTFTSPSVYVVYSSLRATVTCGSSTLATTGPSFDEKTIGYSSRFLAYGTLEIPGPNCNEHVVAGGFHTIDFQDLYSNPITTSTLLKPGCPPYVNPRLSLPAELTTVDSAWANCEPLFYGAFDLPRFLKKASGGLAPLAVSEPTAIAAGGGTLASDLPALAPATPASAPMAPFRTAKTNLVDQPPDPSLRAEVLPNNAGFSGPTGPSQALPESEVTTPPNAATAGPASVPQAVPDPDNLSPIQLSQLHQALQSTEPAGPIQGSSDALVNSNNGLDSQSVPESASGQGAKAPNAIATHIGPTSLLIDPETGSAKEGNSRASVMLADTRAGPAPAHTQGIANAPIIPSPVLVDPGNGVLLVTNPEGKPAPAGAELGSPQRVSQKAPVPVFVGSGNEVFVEGSSGNRAATSAAVIGALPGLKSSPPIISHAIEVEGPTLKAGPIDDGAEADVANPGRAGNAEITGRSATVAGRPRGSQTSIPLLIGGSTVERASDGALLVAGQTLTPGSQATVSGAAVSVGDSNVVIDGTTQVILSTPIETPTPLMVGGKSIQRASDGALLVAGQTLTPGSQATVSGAAVSVGDSNVVIDGTSQVILSRPFETPASLMIGGNPVQTLPNGDLVVASQTVLPGSMATISGILVSASAVTVVAGETTHVLPSVAPESPIPLLIGGQTVRKPSSGLLIVGSQTIPPGSQATISGIVVSAGTDDIVIDGTTRTLLPQFAATAVPQSVQSVIYTTSNIAVSLSSGATFLSGGSLVTYTGSSTSILNKPTEVAVGTTTVPYKPSGVDLATSGPNVGGLIASNFGASDSSPTRSGTATGSGPALGAGLKGKSSILLRNCILGLLGYISSIGFLV